MLAIVVVRCEWYEASGVKGHTIGITSNAG